MYIKSYIRVVKLKTTACLFTNDKSPITRIQAHSDMLCLGHMTQLVLRRQSTMSLQGKLKESVCRLKQGMVEIERSVGKKLLSNMKQTPSNIQK